MLKKPYLLLEKRGLNRYYTLKVNDIDYLATETIVEMNEGKKKGEFTQALKLLPLTAPMLMLLLNFARREIFGEKEDAFGDKEEVYTPLGLGFIKQQAHDLFKDVDKNFEFVDSVDNPTIKSYIENDGFELYCLEQQSKHMYSSWLIYSNERGLLRIMEVITAGKEGFNNVIATNSYVLDRSILVSLFEQLRKNELN
jgi:hypothetical protein